MKSFKQLYLEVAQPHDMKNEVKFKKLFTDKQTVVDDPQNPDHKVFKDGKKDTSIQSKNDGNIKDTADKLSTKNPAEDKTKLKEDKDLKALKKSFGDFRTTLGKSKKKDMEEKAKAMKEAYSEYSETKEMYYDSTHDLLDEIRELMDTAWSDSGCYMNWKAFYRGLEDLRDTLLDAIPGDEVDVGDSPVSESINEEFKAGSVKLHDGSTQTLSKQDAKALNEMIKQAGSSKAAMEKRIMKSASEFKNLLTFAKEAS